MTDDQKMLCQVRAILEAIREVGVMTKTVQITTTLVEKEHPEAFKMCIDNEWLFRVTSKTAMLTDAGKKKILELSTKMAKWIERDEREANPNG